MKSKFVFYLIILVCVMLQAAPVMAAGDTTDITGTVPIMISDISVSNIGYYSGTISWNTSANSTSQVFYDTAAHDDVAGYAHQTSEIPDLVLQHSIGLTGLASSTTYHYRVKSEIPGTDIAISNDYTFTTLTPSGGGGGGGEPTSTINTDLFGEGGTNPISSTGEVLKTIEGTSSDGNLDITIPKGTIAKEKDGTRLKSLSVKAYQNPPAPPADAHIIGLTYDFQPRGATFDPPMTLTWSYDPATLGDVAEDSLVLAYYNEATGKWVELESVVDTVNHTVTARVPHFTVFAIIGTIPPPPPPVPAKFAVSNLAVTSGEIYVGEPVTIRILVANTGGESGSCNVTLKINGVVEATKEMTVSAGLSKEVAFSVSKTKTGIYTVDINGLTQSFTVKEKPAPPPAPAKFAVSGLVVTPGEIYVGESVAIKVLVANTGGESGCVSR